VKSGNFVVKGFTALVEASPGLTAGRGDDPGGDLCFTLPCRCQLYREVEQIEETTGIAVGGGQQALAYFRGHLYRQCPQTEHPVGKGMIEDGAEFFFGQGLEDVNPRPGQQGIDQGETGVFRRCADESHDAFFHIG